MKILFHFVSSLTLIVALALLACETGKKDDNNSLLLILAGGGGDDPPHTYAIGDTGPSGVGLVFYVTDGGVHGLEVAPDDQSDGSTWSTITSALANGTSALPVGIGTGSANTDAIILQNGGDASAAKLCRDYRETEEGDWFLPSRDELNAIWVNLVDDGFGNNSGTGGFANDDYWSSSEDDAGNAWDQNFSDGDQYVDTKSITFRVRAVRAF